jgi:hypothetical protein
MRCADKCCRVLPATVRATVRVLFGNRRYSTNFLCLRRYIIQNYASVIVQPDLMKKFSRRRGTNLREVAHFFDSFWIFTSPFWDLQLSTSPTAHHPRIPQPPMNISFTHSIVFYFFPTYFLFLCFQWVDISSVNFRHRARC